MGGPRQAYCREGRLAVRGLQALCLPIQAIVTRNEPLPRFLAAAWRRRSTLYAAFAVRLSQGKRWTQAGIAGMKSRGVSRPSTDRTCGPAASNCRVVTACYP